MFKTGLFKFLKTGLTQYANDCDYSIIKASIGLTDHELTWIENGISKSLLIDDIVGAFVDNCDSDTVGLVVHSYLVSGKYGQRVLHKYRFICPDIKVRSHLITAINNRICGFSDIDKVATPRQLEILINPSSGKGKSKQIFESVKQVLENSYVKFNVTTTTYAGIQNLVKNMDLSLVDGLVVVGGDGSVYAVINGLMNRPDWETAIKTPLGIIPSGTSNGLCKTLLQQAGEPYNSISATIAIARGNIQPLDIMKIQQGDRLYYGILSIAWGLIADVDIQSDKLRFLGSLKTDIYALLRILTLRSYRGKLSLTPAQPDANIYTSIEDNYILLWAMNLPWAAYNLNPAPLSHPRDGTIDLLLVRRGISKLQLIKAFLACRTGEHLGIPGIEYYKLQGFHLDPQEGEILAIDGEPIPLETIKVEVMPKLGRVFHP